MLEKEFAAVIRVILDSAGSPAPYYHNIPESFIVPSVFFPSPEIEFKPDTLSSYGSEYILYVNFFHSTTELAYELAMLVYHDIVRRRRLIPLIDSNGKKTGDIFRSLFHGRIQIIGRNPPFWSFSLCRLIDRECT